MCADEFGTRVNRCGTSRAEIEGVRVRGRRGWDGRARWAAALVSAAGLILLEACGTTSGPSQVEVVVTVSPNAASVFLGATENFQANVTGTANTGVTWEVNGQAGGNAEAGTITAGGDYTAPGVMPAGGEVTVTAVSEASPGASGAAEVTLKDDIAVSIAPTTASVATNAAQGFTATVTGSGAPSQNVTWSVNGAAGGNATVGTIVSNGMSGGSSSATYTAPANVPTPASVTVTATSVADTAKSKSATVTITCSATSQLSPATASVGLGMMLGFSAAICASGAGITWDVNGIAGGSTTVGTIAANGATTAVYTAPETVPAPNPVTVHATAGGATASATVTITSSVGVNVAPATATVAVNTRQSFTATVSGTTNPAVSWSVNGVPNGNSTVGEICTSGSNPCAAPTGAEAGSVDYLAPANVPGTNPVSVAATSAADGTKSGAAAVTITGPPPAIAVTISPAYAFLPPPEHAGYMQQFTATVTETTNTGVTWSVSSGVAGQGCSGTACGTVTSTGLYTTPNFAPSPNSIAVTATSVADPTKSATALVAMTSGPAIEAVLPSSVMAGAVEGFPLSVEGAGFVAGSGSGASQILLNGTARSTTCGSTTACSTALTPADVVTATTVTLQVENPGTPGTFSNAVPFVVVPFNVSQQSFALTAGSPSATELNFVVTEPTTAAEFAAINVDAIGPLANQNCTLGAAPVIVERPASGTTTVSLCIHGNGLDPTFAYALTGPPGGDIPATASAVTGLFPNTIELDLQLSSTAAAGLRTLVITTLNNDRAIATGILEVH